MTSASSSNTSVRKSIGYIDQIVAHGYDQVIGTSGTILSLGTVATALERGSVPSEIRNLRSMPRAFTVCGRPLPSLISLGVSSSRPRSAAGGSAVAGAVLVDSLLKKLGAKEIILCDLALREGLVLDYIKQNRTQIARVDRYPDVRRRSTIELAERSQWEAEHSRQVARLALSLFDQTRELHSLGDREREWLEFAALLHDVGMHISYERHHLHSYYLIKNGDLRGFEPEEIDVIALVARYHRRGAPKRKHDAYSDLSSSLRRTIRVLSGFLRLAEALDRTRNGVVKAVDARTHGKMLTLHVSAVGDSELEVWAASQQLPLLAEELEQPMEVVAVDEPEANGTRRAKKTGTKKTTKAAKRGPSAASRRARTAIAKPAGQVAAKPEPDVTN